MRKLISILALMLVWANLAEAADTALGATINKAGRQRMLTERIVKSYAQVGLDVMPEQSRRQLSDAVGMFETQLRELQRVAPTPAVQESLQQVDLLWQPFKTLAVGPISIQAASRLLEMQEELVRAANTAVGRLEAAGGSVGGKLVNQSGRQRMLTQRLAKLYMLRAWGMETPKLKADMEATRLDFEANLSQLQAAPQNSYAINRELESIALQWAWFESAIEREGEYASFDLVVANASETILSSLENVTRLYENLAEQ